MINWNSLILFYREKYIFSFLNIALAFLIIATLLVILGFEKSINLNVLHYNFFYGIDYLGEIYMLYIYLAVVLIFIFLNFIFSYRIFTKDKYMSYYLNFASAVISIIFSLYIYLLTPYN